MTRTLYIDPFGGAAGDMLLGALLDLGVADVQLVEVLAGLRLPGWRLEAGRERRHGFAGTRVEVHVEEETHPARHLSDIEALLGRAELPGRVCERALAAFRRLFEAEAEVHGVALEKAHLHELAAVDAVIDIVGTCAAVELLQVDRVVCGPVPVGSGAVATAHGILPVPPPAVARLLRGVPLASHAAEGEMTTPTGATLVTTLAECFGPLPAGTLLGVGVGLGTRSFAGLPNLLRVFLVEEASAPRLAGRPLVLVEATIDDATGEALGVLLDDLRRAGALDAWCLPGTGRKGRPLVELRAVAEPHAADAVAAAIFAEGASLGVRLVACARPELERRSVEVATPFGPIPVKVAAFAGKIVSAKPEHDACLAAAHLAGVSLAASTTAARLTPARWAAARQASCSGLAETILPAKAATLTGIGPNGVATSTLRRSSSGRAHATRRTPRLAPSAKMAAATASAACGSATARSSTSGRPFRPVPGRHHASSAPAQRRSSRSTPSASPVARAGSRAPSPPRRTRPAPARRRPGPPAATRPQRRFRRCRSRHPRPPARAGAPSRAPRRAPRPPPRTGGERQRERAHTPAPAAPRGRAAPRCRTGASPGASPPRRGLPRACRRSRAGVRVPPPAATRASGGLPEPPRAARRPPRGPATRRAACRPPRRRTDRCRAFSSSLPLAGGPKRRKTEQVKPRTQGSIPIAPRLKRRSDLARPRSLRPEAPAAATQQRASPPGPSLSPSLRSGSASPGGEARCW